MFSPLDQFENHLLRPIYFYFFELSINSVFLGFFFGVTIFCIFFFVATFGGFVIPNRIQSLFELFYSFVISMIYSQTGYLGIVYLPFVFTLFSFIFCLNFVGLVPYGFTVTAQIFTPFFIAFTVNISLLIVGIFKHSYKFIYLFLPSGLSKFLLPFIFCIELFTYLLRTFSLFLRLFANMMAGHTLLNICTLALFAALPTSIIFGFFSFLIVACVLCLELLISFLQAYVFSVLFCVYLNDSLTAAGGH